MTRDETYKLDELARAAGTSVRTVRYYVQRGLLPAPAFRGKDTAYKREHLVRLRAIRRLQDAFFPLDAIAVELEGKSPAEIEQLADVGVDVVPVATAEPPSSAGVSVSVDDGVNVPTPLTSLRPRLYRRLEIAPGVELSIADDAPAASRTVVEKILKELEK